MVLVMKMTWLWIYHEIMTPVYINCINRSHNTSDRKESIGLKAAGSYYAIALPLRLLKPEMPVISSSSMLWSMY